MHDLLRGFSALHSFFDLLSDLLLDLSILLSLLIVKNRVDFPVALRENGIHLPLLLHWPHGRARMERLQALLPLRNDWLYLRLLII